MLRYKFFKEKKIKPIFEKRKVKLEKKLKKMNLEEKQRLYEIVKFIIREQESLLGYNIIPPDPPPRSSSFNLL